MSEKQYSLFIPPGELGAKTSGERSPKEARAYYYWLLGVLDQRISDLLAYFGERLTREAEEDLKILGGQVAAVVKSPQFSYQGKAEPIVFKKGSRTLIAPPATEMEPRLTNVGYALAADMGLLVAKLFLGACGSKVKWMLVTKPKNDVSYQRPVLTGFGPGIEWLTVDPIRVSVSNVYAILREGKGAKAWLELFLSMKKKASC